ncbi:hypothetical protein EVAR_68637_1 [Eumeta japonica]|uniref:Uncharacterized protein n=1 Tax=Eumeta variegata TaxID=151549 RepID=A0A4C1ZU60_EUMVA|nr:hypothetical protein EVAR_68637_1 [Eumeta japonica]
MPPKSRWSAGADHLLFGGMLVRINRHDSSEVGSVCGRFHRHSPPQKSHQCDDSLLDRSRLSNRKSLSEGEWATGTLALWTKRDSGSYYFT